MSFKLKSPYVDNTVPVFKVPMENGVYGKANNDTSSNSGFNIHVNQNINDTATFMKVVEHENGHIDQMARGDMDYDDDYVYWKGQKIPRANMPEGAHNLPWEKEIYEENPVNMKLRNGSGNHPAFANLSERGLIKSPAMLAEGDDKKLKAAKTTGEQSEPAKEQIKKNIEEGYKTTSVKRKDNIRSTVMEIEPKKPKTVDVPEPETQTKQYAGAYVKRKVFPGYKPVKSESAEEAFVGQKRKGRLKSFESLGKKADRG